MANLRCSTNRIKEAFSWLLNSAHYQLFILLAIILVIASFPSCQAQLSVSGNETYNPASCYEDCRTVFTKTRLLCGKQASKFQDQLRKCGVCLQVDDRTAAYEIFGLYPSLLKKFEDCGGKSTETGLKRLQSLDNPSVTIQVVATLFVEELEMPTSAPEDHSTPCIPIICNNVANTWKNYILDINITDVEGCYDANEKGELSVLEACSRTPSCIDMREAVMKQLEDCNKMLTASQESKGLIVNGASSSLTVPLPATATVLPTGTIGLKTSNPTSETKRTSISTEKGNDLYTGTSSQKVKMHIFIAITASIGFLITLGVGIGIYIHHRIRGKKRLSDVPDIPGPSLELYFESSGFITELAGEHNKSPLEMTAVREPVEMDAERVDHAISCTELEA